jgi:RNA polymerase sigma-70 factor (ECF subfamily)
MAITVDDLEAARRGDHAAEQVFMDTLYRPVYHFLRKRTGDKEVADELCQTVFLKVFEHLSAYDAKKATVEGWVFMIARRTLIDHYRKEQPVPLPEGYDLATSDRWSAADQVAIDRIHEAEVARLLHQLSEESADVITLRAIDEMPYEAIAEIIGKSPEAIRQIYSRALKELRQLVEREGRVYTL